MKKLIFYTVILTLLFSGSNLFAQNKVAKPLMKITVKDGKVVKSEAYDTTKNHLKISTPGGDKNYKPDKAIRASAIEDKNYNPNKAVRNIMTEKGAKNQNSGIRTTMIEDAAQNPGKVNRSSVKQDASFNPDKTVPASIKQDATFKAGRTNQAPAFKISSDTLKKAKGTNSGTTTEFSSAIFDPSLMQKKVLLNNYVEKPVSKSEVQTLDGWVPIVSEGFEGSFPGVWNVYAQSGYTDAYWEDVSNRYNTGGWSGWCAGAGSAAGTPGVSYPDNMKAWMVYGPFDLSDATDASLSFMCWNNTELNYDFLQWMVSLDGINYYGVQTSGNTVGWVSKSLDLKNVFTLGNVTGQSQVYVAFIFKSDVSNTYEGSYLDDIVLQKYTVTTALPDLHCSALGLSTTAWEVGADVTADVTEDNIGTVSADYHYTTLYLSSDTYISSSEDIKLGSDIYFSSIAAGGYQIQSSTFTVPDVTDGYYYIGAIVDYYDYVAESNESNNVVYRNGQPYISHPATLPDLVMNTIGLSTLSGEVGSSIIATLTTTNYGSGSAGYHYTNLYLSSDTYISSSEDIALATDIYFNAISSGGSDTQTPVFTVPDVADGYYYVGAIVDFYNDVIESNEDNNIVYRLTPTYVYHPALPDLTLYSIGLSSTSWVVGDNITADLTEENIGLGSAGSHSTTMYLSTDTYISSSEDLQLGNDISFNSIASSGTQVQSQTFYAPDVTDGTYYFGVIVDYYDEVAESDENNGYYFTTPITTVHTSPTIDLSWTYLSLSSEVWNVNDNITADLTEINYGSVASGSHSTRLYLSTNNIISASDTQLGADISFGSIDGGGYLTMSSTFTVPNVTDGDYYVGAIVDFYDVVSESDETNNVLYRSGMISVCSTCGALPDLVWTYMTLSTDTWPVGNSITADLTVENIGLASAGSQLTRIYLSDNDIISSTDTQLGSDLSFGAINAGGNQIVSETFTVPIAIDGVYYVGALVDFYDNVPEGNESNNGGKRTGTVTVISSGSYPDLEWSNLTLSTDSWVEGNSITAGLTVVNNSTDATAGAQSSRIYLSANNIISATDTQLGSDLGFTSIGPSGNQVQSVTFYAPAGSGTYYIGALVDYYNDVVESDETNNGGVRSGLVTITPSGTDYPDLAPTYIALTTDQWQPGNSITADLTEENFGPVSAGNHDSRLLLSDNTTITISDPQLGSDINFTPIAAGSSLTMSMTFTVPDVADGTYYIGIMTDVNNSVTESDESNNIQYRIGPVTIVSALNTPDIKVTPASLTINEVVSGKSSMPVLTGANNVIKKAAYSMADKSKAEYVPNQLIVKFKSDVGTNIKSLNSVSSDLETFNTKYNVSVIRQIGKSMRQMSAGGKGNLLLMRYESKNDIYSVIEEFRKLNIVEYAEPDYIMKYNQEVKPNYTPGDPLYSSQWGLKNTGNAISYTGSQVGTMGEDINVEPAWDISQGSSGIIVAVIDCGVDLTHSEFSGRFVSGYDFVNGDNDPTPLPADGHGTSCTGIIAAANDGYGMVGVAPMVKIMPIKSMEDGSGTYSAITDGVYFAVDNGAKVISMSLGGTGYSLALEEAVNYAYNNGVTVLAAAGNEGTDNLVTPHYPASFENCISVGAMSPCGLRKTTTTCDGEFWWGSNYGDLDFIAPGTRIYTTDISGSGGYTSTNYLESFNGTSSACPFAAGVAALILSVNPSLTPAEVRLLMQNSSTDVGSTGYDSETGFGRLNAYEALQLAPTGGNDLLTITNLGTGTLTVNSISQDKAWLTTSNYTAPFDLASNESIIVKANIDWSLLSATEVGTISISSNDPDESGVDVPVTVNPLAVDIFNITIGTNPTVGGTVTGSGQYGLNQTIEITASPAAQYTFVNWTESGVEIGTNATYSFTVNSDRNLIANFALRTPNISAVADPVEGGTISGAGTYSSGVTATLVATPAATYQFVNWTENGEVVSTNSTYSFVVTIDRSLTAVFSIDPLTISTSSFPIAAGTIKGAGNYLMNQTANLTAVPEIGYDFVNWTEDGDVVSVNQNYIFTVTRNRTLVANFSVKTIEITATKNPVNGGSVSGTGSFSYGAQVTLTATSATGYHFVSWTESSIEVSTNPSYVFTATVSRSLIANFAINAYNITVTVDPVGSGTVTGDGSYIDGANATLFATPANGYHFLRWTENSVEVSTNVSYSFTVTSNRALVAKFELNSYNITLSEVIPINSGTVTGAGTYQYGTQANLLAIPATGYHFKSWTVGGAVASINASYSFIVTSDVNLVANFEINTYTISANVDPVSTGTYTGTGIYDHGSNVTVVAIPATGYHFLRWTENNVEVSSSASYSFTATSDRILVAIFEINKYTISTSADPANSGTITGNGIYNHGSEVNLVASPSTDFYFINWTENSAEVSVNSTYTFTATGDRNVVANFGVSPPSATSPGNVLQTSFTARWNNTASAAGYRIDVATDQGFTSYLAGYSDKDVGNVTSSNIIGLSAKTNYYYRLRAYNSNRISQGSNTVAVITLTNPSSVPTSVQASSCNDLVTLDWAASTGSDFNRYRIFGGTSSNPSTKIDSTATGITNTTKAISGLTHGQTYYFRVTAVNTDGVESSFSSQISIVVKTGVIPKITGKWDNNLLICYNIGDSLTGFQWYKDASKIMSATKQYYATSHSAGTYSVETTDENGCKNYSNAISILAKGSLSVFPNPASVSFSLKLDDNIKGRARVSIINSNGLKIMEFQVEDIKDEKLKEILVNNLDEGLYVVQVLVNQKDFYSTKIVILK